MQLHELKLNKKRKRKKRIGRGGKRGTYSGRGQKGQKARAGHRIRPAERDLLLRFPKLRGIKHRPLRPKPKVINVGDIMRFAKDGVLNKKILVDHGFIKKTSERVKILSVGEIKSVVVVEGLELSEKAKDKILAAGGEVRPSQN